MYQFEFTGRCPSKAQIIKQIKIGLKTDNWVQVSWGENQITIENLNVKNTGGWHTVPRLYGSGWIRQHSGSDIAQEIS